MKIAVYFVLFVLQQISGALNDQYQTGDEKTESCGCGTETGRGSQTIVPSNQEISIGGRKGTPIEEDMVTILGGIGYIGTDSPIMRRDGEGPRRQVKISSFHLDRYEVSNAGSGS